MVNPGFEMDMEIRGLLRIFFWSRVEASAVLQCPVSKGRGFLTNQYDVSSQIVVMRVQDFVENVRNNIENIKNKIVFIGRNIIDSIKVNVYVTDFGLACSVFFRTEFIYCRSR